MRSKRFQNHITSGRWTLPAAVLISALCWLLAAFLLPDVEVWANCGAPLRDAFGSLGIPAWGERLFSYLLYGGIGYLLVQLNNMFAIIRMRASVQTSLYFLLVAACPALHTHYVDGISAAALLASFFFLFGSYQQTRPEANLFHAFAFIGLGSLFFPQLTLLAPLFWIGAYNFRSLHPRSFFASLIGWCLPYCFLLGYAYCSGQMELFYRSFEELVRFEPVQWSDFEPWMLASIGYLLVLFVVSATHCFLAGYEDKIRTRSYLNFLILISFCMFVGIGLQPAMAQPLLVFLLPGIGILAGHLFVLTGSRASNLFFIASLAGLFLLFLFNVWTLL